MVFDPNFFVAEKPLPMSQTCIVVNFHNLHSLLDQIGDYCWSVVKKITSSENTNGKLKISCRRKGQLVVSYQHVSDPCCGLSVSIIFCGFILYLIGSETINIPEILL